MNRQRGVWITILCILVIGVSVTKMTRSFIASGTLETIAANAVSGEPEEAGTNLTEIASTGQTATGAPAGRKAPASGIDGSKEKSDLTEASETAAARDKQKAKSLDQAAAPAMEGAEAGAAPAAEAPAENTASAGEASSENSEDKAAPKIVMYQAARDSKNESDSAAGSGSAADEALQETVKSPLDPAGPGYYPTAAETGNETEETASPAKEYEDRLDQTASQITQYRSARNDATANSMYMAAEYEWGLWDNELNTLYSMLRVRMNEEEAEKLKQEELSWLKERDAAAEKAASKTNSQMSRNTAYLEASARETKDRCYKLLEEYGEILEREEYTTLKKVEER